MFSRFLVPRVLQTARISNVESALYDEKERNLVSYELR